MSSLTELISYFLSILYLYLEGLGNIQIQRNGQKTKKKTTVAHVLLPGDITNLRDQDLRDGLNKSLDEGTGYKVFELFRTLHTRRSRCSKTKSQRSLVDRLKQ